MVEEERKLLYEESNAISNSDIGIYILGGPKYLQRSKSTVKKREAFFDKGSALHCYILENQKFNERYYIAKNKLNGMFGGFLRDVVQLVAVNGVEEEVALAKAYESSTFKLSLEVIIKKFKSEEVQELYQDMLNNCSKTELSDIEFKDVKNMVDSLYSHKGAVQLLPSLSPTFNTTSPILEFDEVEIYWKYPFPPEATSSFDFPSFELECKSKVDRLIIDTQKKTVKLVDIKTTSKPAKGFIKSYKNYKYYRQLAYYRDATAYYMKHVLNLNPDEYTFECFIIVVETSAPYCVKVFKPLEIDLQFGTEEYVDNLKEIAWHIKNDVWEDRSTTEGDGSEPITLITFDELETNNDAGNDVS
jgi:hypothetical protein